MKSDGERLRLVMRRINLRLRSQEQWLEEAKNRFHEEEVEENGLILSQQRLARLEVFFTIISLHSEPFHYDNEDFVTMLFLPMVTSAIHFHSAV